MNTTIEHDESDIPLSHLVERDYCRDLELMVAVESKISGIFGDDIDQMRSDLESTRQFLEEADVEQVPFTDGELLDAFGRLMGLALSSGGLAAVLERYRNEMGMT